MFFSFGFATAQCVKCMACDACVLLQEILVAQSKEMPPHSWSNRTQGLQDSHFYSRFFSATKVSLVNVSVFVSLCV